MIPAEYIVKGFRFSLAAEVQAETGDSVELAFVDQDYSGPKPAAAASAHGIALEVVKGARGQARFVLLPRRWVVDPSTSSG